METQTPPSEQSLGELFKALRDDTAKLVREEVVLAKTEISEKVKRTGKNMAFLAIGGLVGFVALILLLVGLAGILEMIFLALDLTPAISRVLGFVAVGGGVAVVAAVLIAKGLQNLKKSTLVPEKTLDTLKEGKDWAKEKIN